MIEFFSLFWNVLFCLYCLVFSRFLFSLHSFFFFCSSCHAFSVSSEYFLMFHLSILASVEVFLSVIQVWLSTRVLIFCQWSSRGHWFFHRPILLQRILSRLLGYLTISRSLSWFRIDCPPVLVFERRQRGFLFKHDSSDGIYISVFLLGQCLQCMGHCHVVFD